MQKHNGPAANACAEARPKIAGIERRRVVNATPISLARSALLPSTSHGGGKGRRIRNREKSPGS